MNYVRSNNRDGNRGYRRPNYQGRGSLENSHPYPTVNRDNGYNNNNHNRNYPRRSLSNEDNRRSNNYNPVGNNNKERHNLNSNESHHNNNVRDTDIDQTLNERRQ